MTGTVQQLRRLASAIRGPEDAANIALGAFWFVAAAVTIVAIVESYSNLADFAWTHQMTTWHGAIAPVAVDALIVLGETMLFIALLRHWHGASVYVLAAGLASGGFALSVAGNVFHAPAATFTDRAIQALWPSVATAALAAALVVIKRLMNDRVPQAAAPAAVQAPPPVPDRAREPRQEEPRRAARAPGLAAASPGQLMALSEAEMSVALALRGVSPLPGEQKLHAQYPGISRRRCKAILDAVRAGSNGSGGLDDHAEHE